MAYENDTFISSEYNEVPDGVQEKFMKSNKANKI